MHLVLKRIYTLSQNPALTVAERALIGAFARIEAGLRSEVLKFRRERYLFIVVVDQAIANDQVSNEQCEATRGIRFCGRLRHVRLTLGVHAQMHDRTIESDLGHINLAL